MKQAAIPAVMWLVVILLYAYVSIADPVKSNNTVTSGCNGSVQECLIGSQLEEEFPTVTSSHLGRMLAPGSVDTKTGPSGDRNNAVCHYKNGYKICFPGNSGGAQPNGVDRCSDPYYRGSC